MSVGGCAQTDRGAVCINIDQSSVTPITIEYNILQCWQFFGAWYICNPSNVLSEVGWPRLSKTHRGDKKNSVLKDDMNVSERDIGDVTTCSLLSTAVASCYDVSGAKMLHFSGCEGMGVASWPCSVKWSFFLWVSQ